jgi:hypothetical protein
MGAIVSLWNNGKSYVLSVFTASRSCSICRAPIKDTFYECKECYRNSPDKAAWLAGQTQSVADRVEATGQPVVQESNLRFGFDVCLSCYGLGKTVDPSMPGHLASHSLVPIDPEHPSTYG